MSVHVRQWYGLPSNRKIIVMGVHHTTVISWVKKIGNKLDNVPPTEEIPQIPQIDELQSFIGKKKIKFGFGLQLINTNQEL